MKIVLPVLAALLASCCTSHADPWLTVVSLTATIEIPPPDRFGGDQWPAEALHILVTAVDGSGAEGLEVDPGRLVLAFGPNTPPAGAFGIDQTRTERRPGQPAHVTAGLWFALPPDRSALESMELRLAVDQYRHEVVEVPFVPGADGWQFPLSVRSPWLDFTMVGVGLGELAQEGVSISRWLLGGDDARGAMQGSAVVQPRLIAIAVASLLESENTVTIDGLRIDFGDFVAEADTVQVDYGLHERQPGTDLWRRAADYAFRYEHGLEDRDLSMLPEIQAITLQVIRRIPLDEAWTPVPVPTAQ